MFPLKILILIVSESKESFAPGLNLLSLLLEKLDTSFWLISNTLNSPTQLFTVICSKPWFTNSLTCLNSQMFEENRLSGDEMIDQFTQSEGIWAIFDNVLKHLSQPHLFCWFMPLLKTIAEFENYFGVMIREMTGFLIQTCGDYNNYWFTYNFFLIKF